MRERQSMKIYEKVYETLNTNIEKEKGTTIECSTSSILFCQKKYYIINAPGHRQFKANLKFKKKLI